jgi:transglutaminase-like putative cysteine protease
MMLRPMEGPDQHVRSFELEIAPRPSLLRVLEDATDAWVALARFDTRADHLDVSSRAEVDHQPRADPLAGVDATVDAAPFTYPNDEIGVLAPSILRRFPDESDVDAWAARFRRRVGRTRLASVLSDMTHALHDQLDYGVRLAGPPQSPAVTLARGGSCRDFAVLMIEAVRSLGLAARFASGYVYGEGAAVSSEKPGHTHAWVRAYLPECGWVDFDPTNGIVGNRGLIRVAAAADPRLTLPLHGAWRGLQKDALGMEVRVDIAAEAAAAQPPAPLRVADSG